MLSDPEKRKKYDEYGENWKHADEFEAQRKAYQNQQGGGGGDGEYWYSTDGTHFSGFGGEGMHGFGGNGSGFSDFFEELFGHRGAGGKGVNGGPDGDLYITFNIADDPVFRRKDNDLYTDVNIDLYTAVLGGEVTVNTLDGQVKLKVRPGTQNDAKARLKGKGFPVYKQDGTYGDLIVTYHVTIPTTLTDKQKDLFRQLQQG